MNRHCKCQSINPRNGRSIKWTGIALGSSSTAHFWSIEATAAAASATAEPTKTRPKGPSINWITCSLFLVPSCDSTLALVYAADWTLQYLDLTLQGPTIFIFLIHVQYFPPSSSSYPTKLPILSFDTSPSFFPSSTRLNWPFVSPASAPLDA